jgi:hypothetical protein
MHHVLWACGASTATSVIKTERKNNFFIAIFELDTFAIIYSNIQFDQILFNVISALNQVDLLKQRGLVGFRCSVSL